MSDEIKVLIVEDHDLVGLGLKEVLKASDQNFITQLCESADTAIEKILKQNFDIVLLDILLKSDLKRSRLLDGDDLLKELGKIKKRPKVLVLSKIDSLSMLDYIINNLGADGFILKSRTSLSEVLPAINRILDGGNYFSETVSRKLRFEDSFLDIDYIDRYILLALSEGIKQGDLEYHMEIKGVRMTLSAIEKRLKKMKMRFSVNTTIQLVSVAIKEGVITS